MRAMVHTLSDLKKQQRILSGEWCGRKGRLIKVCRREFCS